MENVAELIKSLSFFSSLSREDLARVVGKLEQQKFSAGQTIVKQGATADGMYFVQSGAVEVVLEHEGRRVESVAILGPNEFFGEMSLFTGEKRSATVSALFDSVVLKLSNESWEDLLSRYPSISFQFCKAVSQRLAETNRQLSKGRGSFKTLMEDFLSAQPDQVREFLISTSLLKSLEPNAIETVLAISDASDRLAALAVSHPVFVHLTKNGEYEYHPALKEFLSEKLAERAGKKEQDDIHARFGDYFAEKEQWPKGIEHYLEAEAWSKAIGLLRVHAEKLLETEPPQVIVHWLSRLPPESFQSEGFLTRLKAEAYVRLGNLEDAIKAYQGFLSQRKLAVKDSFETARYYQELAELHQKKGEISEALGCLSMGLNALEDEKIDTDAIGVMEPIEALQQREGSQEEALSWKKRALYVTQKLAANPGFRLISPDKKWWGLLLAVAVGWGLWGLQPPASLDARGVHFLASLASAVILWFLDVFDDYVVALGLVATWVLTATVPPETALAGFSKSSWFFVLSVLAMGAAVARSGLLYRIALNLLKNIPPDYKLYTFILSALGFMATPLLPNNKGRLAISIPVSQAISDSLGFRSRSNGSAGLTLSAFIGFSQMSFAFLTGANVCLIGWNLLPAQAKAEFGWGTWFFTALPAALFTLLFMIASIHLFFRPEPQRSNVYSTQTVKAQLEILGPLNRAEWLSITVLTLALLGWLGEPIHGIDESWVALGAFLFFLTTGVLEKNAVKNNIDWGYLIFIGVMSSLAGVMAYLGVDRWLLTLMDPVLSATLGSPLQFLFAAALLVYLARFLLNKSPAMILLSLGLIPWAEAIGVHPGIILITILMAMEAWFLPHQTDSYQIAYYITEEKGFSHAQARKLMIAKLFCSFLAIAISVPYWKMLGYIR